jgi:hypothetical protein
MNKGPNKAAPGNGAIRLVFDTGRPYRAVPEQRRWAPEKRIQE